MAAFEVQRLCIELKQIVRNVKRTKRKPDYYTFILIQKILRKIEKLVDIERWEAAKVREDEKKAKRK